MWGSPTFVLLLATICPYLLAFGETTGDVGNANDYIDKVLENLRNDPSVKSQIDPVEIPSFKEDKFEIWNGFVRGLSKLYRHGDCTLEHEDDTTKISCGAAVGGISVSANYAYKALFFWIKGIIEGQVDHLAVNLQVSSKNGNVELESLKVAELGDYRISHITGMSVMLNWLLKIIANNVAQNSRGAIIDAIEGPAADALRNELKKIKLPGFEDFKN